MGGGVPDLCPRRVDSRIGWPGGVGRVVVSAVPWSKGAGASSPSRRGHAWQRRGASGVAGLPRCRFGVPFCVPTSADVGSFCSLRVVDETRLSTARAGDPVLRPCRRRSVASSSGAAGLVGSWCVGDVAAVGLLGGAANRMATCSVQGVWMEVGGAAASSRPRRRRAPALEVEGELGEDPRPTCHSERWAPLVLLLAVQKAIAAMELPQSRACWLLLSLLAVLVGAGDERRIGCAVAGPRKDFFVIPSFVRGLSAKCTGVRVLLDLSVTCVRVLYYLVSST